MENRSSIKEEHIYYSILLFSMILFILTLFFKILKRRWFYKLCRRQCKISFLNKKDDIIISPKQDINKELTDSAIDIERGETPQIIVSDVEDNESICQSYEGTKVSVPKLEDVILAYGFHGPTSPHLLKVPTHKSNSNNVKKFDYNYCISMLAELHKI